MKFTLQPYLRYLLFLLAMPFFVACGDEVAEEGEVEPLVDSDAAIGTEYGSDVDYFVAWDADRDSYLTEDEWGEGWDTEEYWDEWDLNDDTFIDENEFNTAFGQTRWYTPTMYGDWDLDDDNRITEDEWNTGLWDTWDMDDDSRLSTAEYDRSIFE